MKTQDIELPPLPEGFKSYEFPYGGFDDDEMRNYARAAVEAAAQSPEVQALRKDAERYRWLRDPCGGAEHVIFFYSRGDYGKVLLSGVMLDEAIDRARRVERE